LQVTAFTLPVTVRLPLIAAAMIFIAAVASTQTAIFFMARQADRQVETLGQVYLDGLSTALLPYATRDDSDSIRAVLHRALTFHEGIVDKQLAFVDARNGSTIEISRPGLQDADPLPTEVTASATGFRRTEDGTIWIWRRLVEDATNHGTIVANLDVSSFDAERRLLRWLLLLSDLVFSAACAVAGFFMVRRIQKPVATVARHLYDAALGMLKPIESSDVPTGDIQAERMIHAFNAMAHASSERENLLAHLAERQREADLGRLTATIAHEVRNPLGGIRTAISTLKHFGDQDEPRKDAVAFLERGVSALEHVVDATLESYRARPEWRELSRRDFEDLRLFIEADSRSRNVTLLLSLDIPETVPVAAFEVRQVLLNLLLNAVRASSKGGRVELTAQVQNQELVVMVRDEGSGLDHGVARAIEGGAVVPEGPGLGVAIVIRLVERLHGRVTIESEPGRGTSVTLNLPLRDRKPPS
jgi:signal transduction histidine kinase